MKILTKSVLALAISVGIIAPTFAAPSVFSSKLLSSYKEICADESCAEISAYDAQSSRVFTTNSEENQLRILEIDNEGQLIEVGLVDLSSYGGGPNSVAISHGVVAVAVQAFVKQENGTVELFTIDGTHIRSIQVGALPDMVTFTPDGQYLLVANEGEPNNSYTIDPEGTVTIINTTSWLAETANFHTYNNAKLKDVRVYGPNASVSQDLEPEFITVSADSTTAWITLQENNAIAKLDIASATITDIFGLGFKRHDQAKNGFDASDEDNGINIQPQPTLGMYQPDAIASFQRGNATFLVTANEGDSRDYEGYSEEVRVKDLKLDPEKFPNAEVLQQKSVLGRLKTTTANGDSDADGDNDEIYSYGARSFSIWNANGKQVFDSGSQFEDYLAQYQEQGLNVWEDKRSDDKGPEPESVAVGELAGKQYAFIGLERTSGLFIYNISSPSRPTAAGFIDLEAVGDVGPEGLKFIPRDANTAWLLITNEISNTTSLYEISVD